MNLGSLYRLLESQNTSGRLVTNDLERMQKEKSTSEFLRRDCGKPRKDYYR
jgi:hypothetical protein